MPNVRVFISSPSDVQVERDTAKTAIEKFNQTDWAKSHSVKCESLRWEDTVVERITGNINQEVLSQLGPYDIYIGIMASRFGTPSDLSESGTEYEFQDALRRYKEDSSLWISFFFPKSLNTVPHTTEAIEQLSKVIEFKNRVKGMGIFCEYDSQEQFQECFSKHLKNVVAKILSEPNSSVQTNPVNLLKEIVSVAAKSQETKYVLPRFVELNLLDVNQQAAGSADLCIRSCLSDSKNLIALLGEFGSGKTSLCHFLESMFATSWSDHDIHTKVPLHFSLGQFDPTMTLLEWLAKETSQKINRNIDIENFRRLMRSRRCVLLLDAFDEMPSLEKETQAGMLNGITALADHGASIILTCRTTYFDGAGEWSRMRKYIRFYVDCFTENQIVDCTWKVLGTEARGFLSSFRKLSEPLRKIGSKPLFLDMLMEAYTHNLLRDIKSELDLYEVLTSYWSIQESDKGCSILNPNERLEIIKVLALKMFLSGKNWLTISEARECLSENIPKSRGSEAINNCLRGFVNSLFLVRTKDDYLRFSHLSFMEYFVATKLCDELNNESYEKMGTRILYEEIYEFVASIVKKKNLKHKLREMILSPEAQAIARAAAVPPLRKLRCQDSLTALITAHATDENAFVRYIAGYSAEIIASTHEVDIRSFLNDSLRSCMESENNSIVGIVGQRILNGNPLEGFHWKDTLKPYSQKDVKAILSTDFIAGSYAALLNVGREHRYALTEAIRLLTLRSIFCERNDYCDNSLLRFCIARGLFSREIRLRTASVWAIGLLRGVSSDGSLDEALREATEDVDSRVSQLASEIIDNL